jgi:hypothetical protein
MFSGGKKFQKPTKTKFRKNRDHESMKHDKQKHHDKSFYRLAKQEKEEYVV